MSTSQEPRRMRVEGDRQQEGGSYRDERRSGGDRLTGPGNVNPADAQGHEGEIWKQDGLVEEESKHGRPSSGLTQHRRGDRKRAGESDANFRDNKKQKKKNDARKKEGQESDGEVDLPKAENDDSATSRGRAETAWTPAQRLRLYTHVISKCSLTPSECAELAPELGKSKGSQVYDQWRKVVNPGIKRWLEKGA